MSVIFLADFFIEDFTGGAELHDDVVISHLASEGMLHSKTHCRDATLKFLEENRDKTFMIGNFCTLPFESLVYLAGNCKYVLYEHDYKFIDIRNPIRFPNFIAPRKNIVNINFYKNAQKVICLSKMHRKIFDDNLGLDNIVNTNCSMWTDDSLNYMTELLKEKPTDGKYAVIESANPIKKTREAVEFCRRNTIEFELISSPNPKEFLEKLSKSAGLVFMTGHPEPTPRIAIEAKMLGCNFISQKNLIGVAHEEYFDLSGEEMIEHVRAHRDDALEKIKVWLHEV